MIIIIWNNSPSISIFFLSKQVEGEGKKAARGHQEVKGEEGVVKRDCIRESLQIISVIFHLSFLSYSRLMGYQEAR